MSQLVSGRISVKTTHLWETGRWAWGETGGEGSQKGGCHILGLSMCI